MSIGVYEFWHPFDRLFQHNRFESYGEKTPGKTVERLLLQMEKLLAKKYRVFVAAVRPYEILLIQNTPALGPINQQWILEVNNLIKTKIQARNVGHDATDPTLISHFHIIDVYSISSQNLPVNDGHLLTSEVLSHRKKYTNRSPSLQKKLGYVIMK